MNDSRPDWSHLTAQELQRAFDKSRAFDELPFAAGDSPGTDQGVDAGPTSWSRLIAKLEFSVLGAVGETGELANILKRWRRNVAHGKVAPPQFDELAAELGDIYCYLLKAGNVLGRDLVQLHLERTIRNIIRFTDKRQSETAVLISVAGPSCAGKTTAVINARSALGKHCPVSFVEDFESNPFLSALFAANKSFDCDGSQRWFMKQYEHFFALPSVTPAGQVLVDQEPSAVSIVYSNVFFLNGTIDSQSYSEHLKKYIEIEFSQLQRFNHRIIVFLDAAPDILYRRSIFRKPDRPSPLPWLEAVRQRFLHIYQDLPNVIYVDTSALSIAQVTDIVVAAIKRAQG